MKIVTLLRVAVMMVLAGLILFVPALVAVPMSEPMRRKTMFYPWWIFAGALRLLFGVRMTIDGREHAAGHKYEHGCLVISNHQSVADIPLLVSIYPLPFVAKKEIWRIPFINLAAYSAGAIIFDRAKPEARKWALRETLRRIKEVNSIYLFPEGTRSRNGIPKPDPYLALLMSAWEEKLDIVPIALHGTRNVLRDLTADVAVKIGERIRCDEYQNREAFARAGWGRVVEMFYELNKRAKVKVPEPSPTAESVVPTLSTTLLESDAEQ